MDVTPAKKRDGTWSLLWQQMPQREAFPKPEMNAEIRNHPHRRRRAFKRTGRREEQS
ncbi:hypothetical protein ACFY04_39015 [Streptomyces sp. NPDC001549]|uniref:hypothetical protein n=1 Tax=Streptomyces sp. NPDC001549 TaxID=3364586 RepID=UPI00368CA9FF